MRDELKHSWWVSAGEIERERESAIISIEFDKTYRDYSKLRKEVWNWFRAHAGREDLSPVSKLLLWSVCERRSEERRVGKECRSRWSPEQ